jgi:hypothetical protein
MHEINRLPVLAENVIAQHLEIDLVIVSEVFMLWCMIVLVCANPDRLINKLISINVGCCDEKSFGSVEIILSADTLQTIFQLNRSIIID